MTSRPCGRQLCHCTNASDYSGETTIFVRYKHTDLCMQVLLESLSQHKLKTVRFSVGWTPQCCWTHAVAEGDRGSRRRKKLKLLCCAVLWCLKVLVPTWCLTEEQPIYTHQPVQAGAQAPETACRCMLSGHY